jgi:hypothetical protein
LDRLTELKAKAYDTAVAIERLRVVLAGLNQEIAKEEKDADAAHPDAG